MPCQRNTSVRPTNVNTPVTAITRRDDSVIVHAGNQSFEGPAAIVTVPLGVLKAGSIAFELLRLFALFSRRQPSETMGALCDDMR